MDDYATKSGDILSVVEKFSTYFGLPLSYLVFSAMEQLSFSLQEKDTTAYKSFTSFNVLGLNHWMVKGSDIRAYVTKLS